MIVLGKYYDFIMNRKIELRFENKTILNVEEYIDTYNVGDGPLLSDRYDAHLRSAIYGDYHYNKSLLKIGLKIFNNPAEQYLIKSRRTLIIQIYNFI